MPASALRETTVEVKNAEPYKFKARPVNPKIMQSVGDLGVPRVVRKPPTVAKEFTLSSSSRPNSARKKVAVPDELTRPVYSSFGSKLTASRPVQQPTLSKRAVHPVAAKPRQDGIAPSVTAAPAVAAVPSVTDAPSFTDAPSVTAVPPAAATLLDATTAATTSGPTSAAEVQTKLPASAQAEPGVPAKALKVLGATAEEVCIELISYAEAETEEAPSAGPDERKDERPPSILHESMSEYVELC